MVKKLFEEVKSEVLRRTLVTPTLLVCVIFDVLTSVWTGSVVEDVGSVEV